MISRWQPDLEKALRDAGLDTGIAQSVEPTQKYCDRVAQLIACAYLERKTSWLAADGAINHLYPIMLECPTMPEYAWAIYEAFDAAEYHPDSPGLSEDDVTRPILLAHIGGQIA
jgi:hypothetical protein